MFDNVVMINGERHDLGSGEPLDFLNRQSQGLGYRQIVEVLQGPAIKIEVDPKTIKHIFAKLHQWRLESGE